MKKIALTALLAAILAPAGFAAPAPTPVAVHVGFIKHHKKLRHKRHHRRRVVRRVRVRLRHLRRHKA